MSQMNQISRLLQGQQGGGGQPNADTPKVDTAEQIYVSSLALIKMLKHGEFFILFALPKITPPVYAPSLSIW